VEQRAARDDLAQRADAVAGQLVDRRLRQPQSQRGGDVALARGARGHADHRGDAERQDRGRTGPGQRDGGGASLEARPVAAVVHRVLLLPWTPWRKTISPEVPGGISTTGWFCSARSIGSLAVVPAGWPEPWSRRPVTISPGERLSRRP